MNIGKLTILLMIAFVCPSIALAGDADAIGSAVVSYLRDNVAGDAARETMWATPQVPPGGLIWVALLPVGQGKPSKAHFVLIHDDPEGKGENTDVGGNFRYLVSANGRVLHERMVDSIVARKGVKEHFEYLEEWHVKGESGGYRAFTMADGKLVETLDKRLPSSADDRNEYDTRTKEDYARWQAQARAWPEGFTEFDPTWQWITLAEFITQKSPQWRAPETSPETKEDYAALAAKVPKVAWEQFVEWMKKQKRD